MVTLTSWPDLPRVVETTPRTVLKMIECAIAGIVVSDLLQKHSSTLWTPFWSYPIQYKNEKYKEPNKPYKSHVVCHADTPFFEL